MHKPLFDIHNTDSFDPDVIQCPMHYDAALREQAPVFHDKKNDMYVVSTHKLINEILHDPDTYSSRYMEKMFSKDPFPDEIMAIYAKGYRIKEVLVVSDGEVHDRHRRMITQAFSRKRLKELAPMLAKRATELIDKVMDKGEMEFFKDIAGPLPLNIMQQQLRIPDEEMERCYEWSKVLEAGFNGENKSLETLRYEAEKNLECQLRFAERIEEEMERIKTTGEGYRDDDTLTQLAKGVLDPDDPMDMDEAISYIINLFPATHGTTTLVLMACMHRFTEHPDIQAKIAEDPKVIAKLIEEALRHESPMRGYWRRTLKDTTLGGVDIPAGQWIWMRVSSAHYDECAFANPEVFDIDRKSSSSHLTFSSGIHMCAGRFFARHIITEVLTQLTQRASNFEFIEGANDFKRKAHMAAPAFEALHIKFTPKS